MDRFAAAAGARAGVPGAPGTSQAQRVALVGLPDAGTGVFGLRRSLTVAELLAAGHERLLEQPVGQESKVDQASAPYVDLDGVDPALVELYGQELERRPFSLTRDWPAVMARRVDLLMRVAS